LLVSFQGSNRIDPVFTDLDVFLLLPLSVEPVFLEWALDGVGLVVASAIGIFECVWARIAFFGSETRWVRLLVCFAAPPKFLVVFQFVRSVALDTFRPLDYTRESCMFPLLAIFALRDSWVHVKAPINKALSFAAALVIPDVDPNYGHVRFQGYFNNPRSRSEFDIVEDLVLL